MSSLKLMTSVLREVSCDKLLKRVNPLPWRLSMVMFSIVGDLEISMIICCVKVTSLENLNVINKYEYN